MTYHTTPAIGDTKTMLTRVAELHTACLNARRDNMVWDREMILTEVGFDNVYTFHHNGAKVRHALSHVSQAVRLEQK